MTKLSLEKKESIDGITVYMVFFGIQCLKIEEEIGVNAEVTAEGKSVALTKAQAFFDECAERIKQGLPKTTILDSI